MPRGLTSKIGENAVLVSREVLCLMKVCQYLKLFGLLFVRSVFKYVSLLFMSEREEGDFVNKFKSFILGLDISLQNAMFAAFILVTAVAVQQAAGANGKAVLVATAQRFGILNVPESLRKRF